MSKTAKTADEAKLTETMNDVSKAEIAEATEEATTDNAEKTNESESETILAYCGPSIKNIAREGTVYSGGLPEALLEYSKAKPAIKNLIVPIEKYAALRSAVSQNGTAANIIYKNILSTVKEGR